MIAPQVYSDLSSLSSGDFEEEEDEDVLEPSVHCSTRFTSTTHRGGRVVVSDDDEDDDGEDDDSTGGGDDIDWENIQEDD